MDNVLIGIQGTDALCLACSTKSPSANVSFSSTFGSAGYGLDHSSEFGAASSKRKRGILGGDLLRWS